MNKFLKARNCDQKLEQVRAEYSIMSKTNKFILWCVLVAITSFWMWVNAQIWLKGSLFEVADFNNLINLSWLFVMLLVLLALGFVMFQNRLWSVYLGLIIAVTYMVLFGITNLNLVGAFIMVMLLYHAQDIVIRDVN